jgi:hypothetical protein
MRPLFQKAGIWTAVALIVAVFVTGCGIRDDVDFARTVFVRLVNGLYLARPMIDWNSLKMLEDDIGAQYRGITDGKTREDFERAFIDNFKKGFESQRANTGMFKNWRLLNTPTPDYKIVAADVPASKAILLFMIQKAGGQRLLTEIKALQATDTEALRAFEQEHHLGLWSGKMK